MPCWRGGSCRVLESREDLVHRDPPAGADVQRLAIARGERQHVRASDVANIDVVLLLLAVAINGALFPGEQQAGEDGADSRLAVGVLARTVGVGVAQDCVVQPVRAVVEVQVDLPDALRGAIRRKRPDGVRFRHGHEVWLAIQRAASR